MLGEDTKNECRCAKTFWGHQAEVCYELGPKYPIIQSLRQEIRSVWYLDNEVLNGSTEDLVNSDLLCGEGWEKLSPYISISGDYQC